jgi:hypothetical protein
MYNTKSLANSSLKVFLRARHCPFMNSKGVIISSGNSLFLLGQRYKSFKALPDEWRGEKKHSNQPNSSFTVTTAKSVGTHLVHKMKLNY